MTDLERARIVIDNLAARVGALTAENLELLVRIHDLEQAQTRPEAGSAPTTPESGLPQSHPETTLPDEQGAPS